MKLSLLISSLLVGGAAAFTASTAPAASMRVSSSAHAEACRKNPASNFRSSGLRMVADSSSQASDAADYDALLKYHGAIVLQMGIISGVLKGLDTVVDLAGITDLPVWGLFPIFYAFSLKSRTFNPLNNQRPNLQKAVEGGESAPPSKGFRDRAMPSWTPPGPVFPIMWLLIIGPLRAYSSSLVWEANGHHFFDPAILALMFHLSVGDVWNTMNNTEKRYGAAVTGVLCVTASALNAAYQYHTVDETAGNLLGLPMIWFAVAASLVTATWKLNPEPTTGEPEPLYPVQGKSTTEFAWFGGGSDA